MIPNEPEQNQWPSISTQSSILGICILLISQRQYNNFLLISIALVFSLFILQGISHRFLYFKPVNTFMNQPTFAIDTFILYSFTYIAGVLLFLGIVMIIGSWSLTSLDIVIGNYIFWISGTLLVIIPAYFLIDGKKRIRNRITEKLKNCSFKHQTICPICRDEQVLVEAKVIKWNDLRITVHSPKCKEGNLVEIKTGLRVG